jgi:hypothetical protein
MSAGMSPPAGGVTVEAGEELGPGPVVGAGPVVTATLGMAATLGTALGVLPAAVFTGALLGAAAEGVVLTWLGMTGVLGALLLAAPTTGGAELAAGVLTAVALVEMSMALGPS